ncbi:MAG: NusG domain II-containing protein [Treponema sp.]|jgi:hypothetical protein|nr:NusG domain II-containing protein [Treponema sp.]
MRAGITVLDTGIIVLALGLVLFSAATVYAPGAGVPQVVVESDGRRWEFPLGATETIAVDGPLGDTVVELRERRVRVVSSPCTGQNCVAAGAIRGHGQWIACLPNRVMVSVQAGGTSGEGPAIDASSW